MARRSPDKASALPGDLRHLLAECKARPQDELPRQVLADWLEEHGATEAERARGTFVRRQVAAARLPEGDGERLELELEAGRLERQYRLEWLGPLARWLKCWFQRGLVGIALDRRVLSESPWAEIERSGAWAWVETGRGSDRGEEFARALAEWPLLAHLTALDFDAVDLKDRGVAALVQSPHAANLVALKLGASGARKVGPRALAQAPHLGWLEFLALDANGITARGAAALAASPYLHDLRIVLWGNTIRGKARQALLQRFGAEVWL
jgi:uncharacterized protein (TIGR02996 family)